MTSFPAPVEGKRAHVLVWPLGWLTPPLALFFCALALALSPLAGAEEGAQVPPAEMSASDISAATNPVLPPAFFDLPPIEVLQWRLLDAEGRAARAEIQFALQSFERQREAMLKVWQERYNLDDLSGWQINPQEGKLQRTDNGKEATSGQ